MSALEDWNELSVTEAASEILPCCGSRRWAHALALSRPFLNAAAVFAISDEVWRGLDPSDWNEAFSSHPRIGEKKAPDSATVRSAQWSSEEQSGVAKSGYLQDRLRDANRRYEARFGKVCIVCATGKSAEEMLTILNKRLDNDEATELSEAAEQQRQITQLRLRKWLGL